MARKRTSARSRLAEWLSRRRPERITEELWQELRLELQEVSEDRLRHLLRESGLALDPLVEAVRQDSFDSLERTLLALAWQYQSALEAEDRERAALCRRLVIQAKERARWVIRSARTSPQKKADKQEMLLWMLTWLENPRVFADWLRLRKPVWERSNRAPEALSGPQTNQGR